MKEAEDRRQLEREADAEIKKRFVTLDQLTYYCIGLAVVFWIVALILGFGFGI